MTDEEKKDPTIQLIIEKTTAGGLGRARWLATLRQIRMWPELPRPMLERGDDPPSESE